MSMGEDALTLDLLYVMRNLSSLITSTFLNVGLLNDFSMFALFSSSHI